MCKKDSSFSGLEVPASQNGIKNVNHLFYLGEIYTSMACGSGPGNVHSEYLKVASTTEKFNFAATKTKV